MIMCYIYSHLTFDIMVWWDNNNHIIANYQQRVPVKKIENWSIIGEDIDKSKVPRFLRTTL